MFEKLTKMLGGKNDKSSSKKDKSNTKSDNPEKFGEPTEVRTRSGVPEKWPYEAPEVSVGAEEETGPGVGEPMSSEELARLEQQERPEEKQAADILEKQEQELVSQINEIYEKAGRTKARKLVQEVDKLIKKHEREYGKEPSSFEILQTLKKANAEYESETEVIATKIKEDLAFTESDLITFDEDEIMGLSEDEAENTIRKLLAELKGKKLSEVKKIAEVPESEIEFEEADITEEEPSPIRRVSERSQEKLTDFFEREDTEYRKKLIAIRQKLIELEA